MAARSPLWARVVLGADRLVARGAQMSAVLRDEIVWALAEPAERPSFNAATYAREERYAPGAPFFERGLFAWEDRMLAQIGPAKGGRVLVGGGGGGREMRALHQRGYVVTAFEPCAPLAEAASRVAGGLAGARALHGAYEDLGAAARGEGRLAPLRRGGPYALVVLGWRSLSHVIDGGEREALFASLARLAPEAPMLASFLPRLGNPHAGSRRRALRRALAALGAPGRRPAGGEFFPNAGFAIALARDDFEREARDYAVVHYEEASGEGIVVLRPVK